MKTYEYIRLYFGFGDLEDLNALGSAGWRVVTVSQDPAARFGNIALLERRAYHGFSRVQEGVE